MNMMTVGGMSPTMSSREIAVLTEKEHKNVKRDIEKMLEELAEDTLKFERIYQDSMNREQTEFLLDRELTETLLTGYSAILRRKVVARWRELEARPTVSLDPLAGLPPEQRALVGLMLENAQIKQEQGRQAAALALIEQRVEESEQHHLMLARPTNAESIVHIRDRINKLYGLPARIVDTVMRQSVYAPKPAGMVKNAREEAQGSSYAVYWTKDVSKVFDLFVAECQLVTATQATHPLIDGRFKLIAAGRVK